MSEEVLLYRITHINNLDFILETRQLTCPNHPNKNQNYIGIGDQTLINRRSSKSIPIRRKTTFLDYVAFYFCPRAPMLYNIQNGYHVPKHNPQNIIHIVTSLNLVKKHQCSYLFSDGHGYHHLTRFFDDDQSLEKLDWTTIQSNVWYDTKSDSDRKRRKQAECLIAGFLPVEAILGIGVYNQAAKEAVCKKLRKFEEANRSKFTFEVWEKPEWYY